MSGHHHHGGGPAATDVGLTRFAVVGSPNSGKTTLFNALTGLHAKTGNYPGVTVARFEGRMRLDGGPVVVEDLPGTYSLDPISPDEQIVVDVLDTDHHNLRVDVPDALLVMLNATTLRRSLGLLAQLLQTGLPVCVVLTFTDDSSRERARVRVAALSLALGGRTSSQRPGTRCSEIVRRASSSSAPSIRLATPSTMADR